MNRLRREHETRSLTIASAGTDSDELDLRPFAGGGFILPAAFTGASLTFLVAEAPGGTYQELRKTGADEAESVAVTQGKAYPFPERVFDFGAVKLKSASAEAAARTVLVSLKG